MADKGKKYPENAPGKYYVDSECTECGVCRDTAPDNFGSPEGAEYTVVIKQPNSDDEEQLCEESKENCPVEAIGDDGEE